jgi:hypothetical protein
VKATPTNLLFVRDGGYQLAGREPLPTLEAALAGVEKGPITLAVPSQWCLCAMIDAKNLPRVRRPAMLFRLEEKLPLAAEEIVGDFIEHGEAALGVAGQLRPLQPLVSAVDDAGFTIETIAPAALLAGQRYLEHGNLPACDGLLFELHGQFELLQLADGIVTGWETLADAEDVAIELGVRGMNRAVRVACGASVEMRAIPNVEIIPVELPPAEPAAFEMAQALRRGASPLVELRRDPLGAADALRGARSAIRAAMLAAIFLVVAVFGAVLWRASEYQRLTVQYEHEQQELFQKTFPGKTLNDELSVATQLLREERRLRALAGGDGADVPARVSSLAVLQRVLTALPADGRCQVSELRLNEDKVWIEAVVPSHADATSVATSLAADKGFAVEAPRTEQLPGGANVAMTLTATAVSPKGGVR